MGRLVVDGELAAHLQHPTRTDAERSAIRIAEGWLFSVTRSLPVWSDPPPDAPVPEDLHAWALELAGIAYDNPQGLTTRTVEDDTRIFAVTRRREILDAAAACYGGVAAPLFSFPPAPTY